MEEKVLSMNKVETVLSEDSIFNLDWAINWFCEKFPYDAVEVLMKMLKRHIGANPLEDHENTIDVVSAFIQLKDHINRVVSDENPNINRDTRVIGFIGI